MDVRCHFGIIHFENKITEKDSRSPQMEITDSEISTFVETKVNLKKDKVKEYREQVNNLIVNFDDYLSKHEDFSLRKLLHFGSCAKGTAISTTSDLDVAVYLKSDKEGAQIGNILSTIRDCLSEAMTKYGMTGEQFTIGKHCVCVTFKGSKLEVDVVPVIPLMGDSKNDWGWLMDKHGTERLKTSIPLHLKFIRKRKKTFNKYAPFVRLTKWWKSLQEVPLKSFLIELIWAHLIATEEIPASYCDGFPIFFKYILTTKLKEPIVFSDNYSPSEVTHNSSGIVRIYDPVNPENNAGKTITSSEHLTILQKSQEAMNILMMATCAPSKAKAIDQWQRILGASFNPYNF